MDVAMTQRQSPVTDKLNWYAKKQTEAYGIFCSAPSLAAIKSAAPEIIRLGGPRNLALFE